MNLRYSIYSYNASVTFFIVTFGFFVKIHVLKHKINLS